MADSYFLSAVEVKALTNWPDPIVDEWLATIENIRDALADLSSTRGSVTSLGAGTGSGFTSARTGTGSYTITFDFAKENADYLVFLSADTQDYTVTQQNKTTSSFDIRTSTGGVLSDSGFDFMVKV